MKRPPRGEGATAVRAHDELAARFGLDRRARDRLAALTAALAGEDDPPTTVREPLAIVDRHLADSLVALELDAVRGSRRCADIGSGAGFPGLPLAVALSGARFDLLEAARRKAALIGRLAEACGLTNTFVIPERVESWASGAGRDAYDLVVVRAVGPLATLVEYGAPLLRLGGTLVAWKGRRDAAEEKAGAAAADRLGLTVAPVHPVRPFPAARDRHLHVFPKRKATPPGFPRRPGRAAKRPLA